MFSSRACLIVVMASLTTTPLAARDYVVAAGVGFDDAGGYTVNLLGDVAVGEQTWFGLSAGLTRAETFGGRIETQTLSATLTHEFGRFGVTAGLGTWGDEDALESRDYRAGFYYRGERWRIGVDTERRDIDLTFGFRPENPLIPLIQRDASARADGVGASIRYRSANDTRWYVRGRRYDYNRDLNRLTALDLIRRLTPTTLILADGLRDTQLSAGVEWPLGAHLLGLELGRSELGVGDIKTSNLTVLWTLPVGQRQDLELSLTLGEADDADSSVFVQAIWYFFGG